MEKQGGKSSVLKTVETSRFSFTVLSDSELDCGYSNGCSGSRSDCCTRVCTKIAQTANAEQWGNFLEINAGVMQY